MRIGPLALLAAVGVGVFIASRMKSWGRGSSDDEPSLPDVRDAGPEAMRDPPKQWTAEDQYSDESFPASDPPGNY